MADGNRVLLGSILLLLGGLQAAWADPYLLNPGDELNIHVWNEDALQRDVFILPDGSISFPLVGQIKAAGLAAEVLKGAITKKLSEYMADPEVNVTVTGVTGNVVYLVGQVSLPGPIVMGRAMTVMQALASAGGLTAYAAENGIRLLRSVSGSTEKVFRIRYADLKDGSDLSSNYTLQAGDVIVVP